MQQKLFNIFSHPIGAKATHSSVSFKTFIAHLKSKQQTETKLKKQLYNFVLDNFNKYKAVTHTVDIQTLKNHTGLLDLLYMCLFPPLSSEQEVLWALSAPNSDTIFYSTPSFYTLMSPANPCGMYATASETGKILFCKSLNQGKYALILERLYNIQPFIKEEIIYVCTDKDLGLPKYYSIQVDNRFVEVVQTAPVPKLDTSTIEKQVKNVNNLSEMEGTLPLSAFSFEGFSIVTATDITARYALHKMRSAIIRHLPEKMEETYEKILSLLQAFCGKQNVQFGLLPFLQINDRPVAFYGDHTNSIAINTAHQYELKEEIFLTWINSHFQNPQIIFYNDCRNEQVKNDILYQPFSKAGIKQYALLPIYHNAKLAGFLELSATNDNTLNDELLSRLDAVKPILAQLLHNHQTEFSQSIDKVIRTNFTSIQPAVQCKFNEVAWKHLRSSSKKVIPSDVEMIRFDDVYPLYGAIDIRNSTLERNTALNKDMQYYFFFLEEIQEALNTEGKSNVVELFAAMKDLQKQTGVHLSENDEVVIIKFMDRVKTFLESFVLANPGCASVMTKYAEAMDQASGSVYQHRRALEKSMQMINGFINKDLDRMQSEFKQSHPVYFEKFRTDGVEYDMYIGQSIYPIQVFEQHYLYKLRLCQLTSMAAIAKVIHLNTPIMPTHLQTTQLIYVNASTIDISFRVDEKRFDVEGSYNIRYNIVKKRIDKVHIKATKERLTQPGKIAIVYSQKEHEEEYMEYIVKLQEEGLLKKDTEMLVLEELQGVTGLKALRVSIML